MIFLHRQNNSENIVDCEIDVRSHPSGLVLNHNRLNFNEDYPTLKDFAKKYSNKTVICNVKESGIEEEAYKILSENNVNVLFLDSQIPDIIRLSKIDELKDKFIIRVSNYEKLSRSIISVSKAKFIWVDWFKFDNFNIDEYYTYIDTIHDEFKNKGVELIIVSPELYNLNYLSITKKIVHYLKDYKISICTKYPELWRENC